MINSTTTKNTDPFDVLDGEICCRNTMPFVSNIATTAKIEKREK